MQLFKLDTLKSESIIKIWSVLQEQLNAFLSSVNLSVSNQVNEIVEDLI